MVKGAFDGVRVDMDSQPGDGGDAKTIAEDGDREHSGNQQKLMQARPKEHLAGEEAGDEGSDR